MLVLSRKILSSAAAYQKTTSVRSNIRYFFSQSKALASRAFLSNSTVSSRSYSASREKIAAENGGAMPIRKSMQPVVQSESHHLMKRLRELIIAEQNNVDYNVWLDAIHEIQCTCAMNPTDRAAGELSNDLVAKLVAIESSMDSGSLSRLCSMVNAFPEDLVLREAYVNKFVASDDLCSDCLGDLVGGLSSVTFNGSSKSRFLTGVYKRLSAINAQNIILSADQLSWLFYGIRAYSSDMHEIQRIMKALLPHMEQFRDTDVIDDAFIVRMFNGLHHKSSALKNVRIFVDTLARLLRRKLLTDDRDGPSNNKVNVNSIRHMLRGLADMTAHSEPVQRLIRVIVDLFPRVDGTMAPAMVGDALFGMRGMTTQHNRPVAIVLERLCEYVDAPDAQFDAVSITACMTGIQSMSDESAGVKRVLSALTKKIVNAPTPIVFTMQQMSICLGSLEGMRTNHRPEVRGILIALVERLAAVDKSSPKRKQKTKQKECATDLDPQLISIAMQGLCAAGTKFIEVGQAVRGVLDFATASGFLNTTDVMPLAFAVRSLVGAVIDGHLPSMEFTGACLEKIECIIDSPDGAHFLENDSALLLLWQSTCFLSTSDFIDDDYRSILIRLQDKVKPHIDGMNALSSKQHERKIVRNVMEILALQCRGGAEVQLFENSYFNGFSTDIILRIKRKDGRETIHDIELDGMYHQQSDKKVWNKLRDRYMSERLGVNIYRVDIHKTLNFQETITSHVMKIIKANE